MSLEVFELTPNAQVEIKGETGQVVTTNPGLTSVNFEGEVNWYTTEYVLDNANVPTPPAPADQPAPEPTQVGSTTIAAVPGPAATSGVSEGVSTSSVGTDQTVDEQIAEAQSKLAELQKQKESQNAQPQSQSPEPSTPAPDGARTQEN